MRDNLNTVAQHGEEDMKKSVCQKIWEQRGKKASVVFAGKACKFYKFLFYLFIFFLALETYKFLKSTGKIWGSIA